MWSILYINISTAVKPQRSFKMKKDKFSVSGMLAMVLALGLAFASCATGGGDPDDGYEVWKKEQFYSTEAKPWISQDDNSLMLVFTESQLKFRYDSNDDGDFEDAGEYTYTYTITDFGGNDWKGRLDFTAEGNYEREITVKDKTKAGLGTNAVLDGITIKFVVTPNLGDDGKIDGKIHISDDVKWDSGPGFFYKNQ
jgi:hypothetical protein